MYLYSLFFIRLHVNDQLGLIFLYAAVPFLSSCPVILYVYENSYDLTYKIFESKFSLLKESAAVRTIKINFYMYFTL